MKILLLRLILAAGCVAPFSGCMSTLMKLPPISGDVIQYDRTDSFGGTHITAKGVKARPDGTLDAEEAEWTTTYPQFTFHVKVVGYKQGPETGAPVQPTAKVAP